MTRFYLCAAIMFRFCDCACIYARFRDYIVAQLQYCAACCYYCFYKNV